MSGIELGNICLPPRRYRIDVHIDSFETADYSRNEDQTRCRGISEVLRTCPHLYPREMKALLKKLSAKRIGRVPVSLASSLYYRRIRIRILGNLYRTSYESPYRLVTTIHLIPRGWDFTLEELMSVNPNGLLATLRSDLNQHGARDADGYFAAFIHGELDLTNERYQLHVHALSADGMIDVVERLKGTAKYASGGEPGRLSVYRRHVVSAKPLANMPHPLTYLLKSFWNWSLVLEKHAHYSRCKINSRMPEPFHSIYLLWLDRWKAGDISLLMGMRVGKAGFILTKTPKSLHL